MKAGVSLRSILSPELKPELGAYALQCVRKQSKKRTIYRNKTGKQTARVRLIPICHMGQIRTVYERGRI